MSKVLQEAVKLAKKPIKIIYAKSTESEALPAGGIALNELISTKGVDFNSLKSGGKPDDVALLPYSRYFK